MDFFNLSPFAWFMRLIGVFIIILVFRGQITHALRDYKNTGQFSSMAQEFIVMVLTAVGVAMVFFGGISLGSIMAMGNAFLMWFWNTLIRPIATWIGLPI